MIQFICIVCISYGSNEDPALCVGDKVLQPPQELRELIKKNPILSVCITLRGAKKQRVANEALIGLQNVGGACMHSIYQQAIYISKNCKQDSVTAEVCRIQWVE